VEWVSVVVEAGTALRLTRRELKEHVLQRARQLAESGRFEGWQGIDVTSGLNFTQNHRFEFAVAAAAGAVD
jgi:hypothetical protein